MEDSQVQEEKNKKERSPSFPFISLPKAIERTQSFGESHKKSAARLIMVAPTWGYAPKSSGLLQTVGALKQFGLMDDFGSGSERKVQLSDLAWRILLDARPSAKEQAIKEAATKPKLILEYLPQWTPSRPNDAHCISELELDRAFTRDAAKTFLKVFDETVQYAHLNNSDSTIVNLQGEQKSVQMPPSVQPPSSKLQEGLGIWHSLQFQQANSQLPISVIFNGDSLQVTATLLDAESVNRLIRALEANKPLLSEKKKEDGDSMELHK